MSIEYNTPFPVDECSGGGGGSSQVLTSDTDIYDKGTKMTLLEFVRKHAGSNHSIINISETSTLEDTVAELLESLRDDEATEDQRSQYYFIETSYSSNLFCQYILLRPDESDKSTWSMQVIGSPKLLDIAEPYEE